MGRWTAESVCEGFGSIARRIRTTTFLAPLLQDVEFQYPRMRGYEPSAGPEGSVDVIDIPDSADAMLEERTAFVCQRLQLFHRRPWRLLGLSSKSFSSAAAFSQWLAMLALDFTAAHEISHVILGHLSLVPRRRGLRLREVRPALRSRSQPISLSPLDYRALEVGADHAAAWLVHFLLPTLIEESKRYQSHGWRGALAGMLFASHLVFSHFCDRDPGIDDELIINPFHPKRHHPPITARLQIIEAAICRQPSVAAQRRINQAVVMRVREAVGQTIACQGFDAKVYAPLLGQSIRLRRSANAAVDRWRRLAPKCLPQSRWAAIQPLADAAAKNANPL